MSVSAFSRRAAVLSLGVFAALSLGAVRRARAQTAVRFRDIRVDVWRLRGSAGDQTADWVEDDLPRDLAKVLAPYMAPAERCGAICWRGSTISTLESRAARGGLADRSIRSRAS